MKEAFGLPRREALWAKALPDEPLELWSAAAEQEASVVQELDEPDVEIRPMTTRWRGRRGLSACGLKPPPTSY